MIQKETIPTPITIAEGYRIDHFGNAIVTSYVDLRSPEARDPIPALVKGYRPEHVIEECGEVRIATPQTFRESGESLIRDPAEGRHSQTNVLHDAVDDPQDLAREEERNAALNRVAELVGFGVRYRTTGTHREVSETDTLDYATGGWLFCASIEPSTPDEWAAWRAALDDRYVGESRIHRPREFASALGHMVAEQLGPQGAPIPVTSSLRDFPSYVTYHPSQVVFHGPVAYVEDVDAWLHEAQSAAECFLRAVFTKSTTHRDQREYRFVVCADEKPAREAHLLRASPALIDAMTRRGPDPSPPALPIMEQGERSPDPTRQADAEPNPLDGTEMWLGLAKSIGERARDPGAIARLHQPDPASLPEDFGRQSATYASVTALRHKVGSFFRLLDQTSARKRDVAAAAWFAEQDIRTLCETFGNPIAGVHISEDGFVVVHISVPESPDEVYLLAVAPSGASALSMAAEGVKSVSLGVDPFHRSNVGQQVKDFIEGKKT